MGDPMGFFDRFKKAAEPEKPAVPASVTAQVSADTLCAPVRGRVCKMADIPDPVFSSEVLGKGCGVWPEGDVVYAPVTGTVTVTMGHAVGIQGDDGVEVLVHVGVDTVNMQGEGFTGYVAQGDHVVAGQAILGIDRGKIASAGYKDVVVLAVSNSAEFASVELCADEDSAVSAGETVLKVAR